MFSKFSKNIAPYVQQQIDNANVASSEKSAFTFLENAHVLGQDSTYWHVRVHCLMFVWGVRNSNFKEIFGQVLRIVGALTKTAMGLVPKGNTGGANISPFKPLPLLPEHELIIQKAKSNKL